MPLIIKIMELRFLAPFFIGVILFLVGILTSKKTYMYLGSIYSLFVVILTSYLIYILPEA